MVTREELQKRLWPDTFVDVDHNLNTAINKIREVLGYSAESPRFIETLSRRGYRFIGALEVTIPVPIPAVAPVESIRSSHSRPTWLKFGAGIVTISVLAVGAVVAILKIGGVCCACERANARKIPVSLLQRKTSASFCVTGQMPDSEIKK